MMIVSLQLSMSEYTNTLLAKLPHPHDAHELKVQTKNIATRFYCKTVEAHTAEVGPTVIFSLKLFTKGNQAAHFFQKPT